LEALPLYDVQQRDWEVNTLLHEKEMNKKEMTPMTQPEQSKVTNQSGTWCRAYRISYY